MFDLRILCTLLTSSLSWLFVILYLSTLLTSSFSWLSFILCRVDYEANGHGSHKRFYLPIQGRLPMAIVLYCYQFRCGNFIVRQKYILS